MRMNHDSAGEHTVFPPTAHLTLQSVTSEAREASWASWFHGAREMSKLQGGGDPMRGGAGLKIRRTVQVNDVGGWSLVVARLDLTVHFVLTETIIRDAFFLVFVFLLPFRFFPPLKRGKKKGYRIVAE